MDSLKISTGRVRLQIVDEAGNQRGIFSFNPSDIESAKRVIEIQKDFEMKNAEFQKRINAVETIEEKITILDELVTYFEKVIDDCFGEGSSQVLFGDDKSVDMFYDFFDGITPYYEKASKERMAKYIQPK
jgi:hypothetical protein